MKHVIGFFSLLFCSLMLFSCEHAPNKHEQLYLDTADSLKLYKNLPTIKSQIAGSDLIKDYLTLTFNEYIEKHDVSEKEVDLMSKSLQVTIGITKTLQSIEENMDEIKPLKRNGVGSNQNGDSLNQLVNKLMDQLENDGLLESEVDANFNGEIMIPK